MPTLRLAGGLSRYNRIEGLSLAGVAGTALDSDEDLAALVRLGFADLVPNGEVNWSRGGDGTRRTSVAVYHRLAASNAWGNPLALGASLGSLFIGRDDGFYYRAAGAEARYFDSSTVSLRVRVFAERNYSARVRNDFSFADAFGDRDFAANISATDGEVAGAEARIAAFRGTEPSDWRLFGEIRVEGAVGDFDYSRAMLEGTVSHPLIGPFMGSVTVSAGASGGGMPVQRLWYLGGSRSLRGQKAGVVAGDAFWMTQLELGTVNVFARPVIFFDAGWAGSRESFSEPGRVPSGAGFGGSFFDGSLRLDVARGIFPSTAWRGMLYIEARM
jgi:hypothetical protein